ncbi:MAG TPA: hypothetical protein VLQ93_20120 [Myxococcaceae bacterium]|nr:hypothetical protein [Myxococcaceae bacterium]
MVVPTVLLLASLVAATPAEPVSPADPTVGFSQSLEGRHARLLDGLELAATFKPSETPPMRILDSLRFGLMEAPLPLDTGGGVSADARSILSVVLGLLVGFGTGHLVAGDRDGFLLFLLVDVAIVAAMVVFGAVLDVGLFWTLGGLALAASHIIQALDAYGKASGDRIVEHTRRKAIQVADVTGGREAPVIATRAFAITF